MVNNCRTGMMRQDAYRSCSKVVLRKRQAADSGSAFSYKAGNSLLHRCPAWIKILVLPVVSIAVFELPPVVVDGLLFAQVVLAFCLHFSLCEQLADLRAVLYYAAVLFFVKVVAFGVEVFAGTAVGNALNPEKVSVWERAAAALVNEKETFFMLLRLLCVMQTASLVFKTSTSLQLREGLEAIELAIRRVFRMRRRAPAAAMISLFVMFIPQVSRNWRQVKRAWKARGGKNSIRMYLVLLPVLFSVGMKQAYTTARAISVRKR